MIADTNHYGDDEGTARRAIERHKHENRKKQEDNPTLTHKKRVKKVPKKTK